MLIVLNMEQRLENKQIPVFEQRNPKPDFDKEILVPLRAKQAEEQKEADRKEAERVAAQVVIQAAPVVIPPQPIYKPVQATPVVSSGLIGSMGYARAGGNCVNEPGVNNPGYGNPVNWSATSFTPWIGATALFNYNHVGVVTGIWSNGDVEIRHQNYTGNQTRFSPGQLRGFR